MRDGIDSETAATLTSRTGMAPINLVWIKARNRETGGIETMGLWNGWDTTDVTVIDPMTRAPVVRTYHAGGSLLDVPAIPLSSELVVQTIRIRLSQINAAVAQAIRGYDPKHAPVEVHRLLLDEETQLPVAPALPRFVGFINGAPIRTPAVGGEGGIEIACVSRTRILTRINPLRRSDEMQKRRFGDRLRKYTDVAGGWLANLTWGGKKEESK